MTHSILGYGFLVERTDGSSSSKHRAEALLAEEVPTFCLNWVSHRKETDGAFMPLQEWMNKFGLVAWHFFFHYVTLCISIKYLLSQSTIICLLGDAIWKWKQLTASIIYWKNRMQYHWNIVDLLSIIMNSKVPTLYHDETVQSGDFAIHYDA